MTCELFTNNSESPTQKQGSNNCFTKPIHHISLHYTHKTQLKMENKKQLQVGSMPIVSRLDHVDFVVSFSTNRNYFPFCLIV